MTPSEPPVSELVEAGELGHRLAALQRAEDAGDHELARKLRDELIKTRVSERERSPGTTAGLLDLELFDRLAGDLARRGSYGPALQVRAAEKAVAERLGDRQRVARALIEATHCLTALVDFAGAEKTLAMVEREVMSAERLWAEARLAAARGQLGCADKLLVALLERLRSQPSERLSAPEIEVFLAEVRIDRGDFAGFERLHDARGADASTPVLDVKWRVLAAGVKLLHGRLGAAAEELSAVLHERGDGEPALALRSARYLLVQALAFLNRLDDATRELALLAATEEASEWRVLEALIAARRSATGSFADLVGEAVGVGEVGPRAAAGAARIERTRERVAEDWACYSHRLQLHLHAGESAAAAEILCWLADWIEVIDSPLLRVRFEHVAALVACARGEYATAYRRACAAIDGYAAHGMALGEWSMCRVAVWAAGHGGPSGPDPRPALQVRARDLLADVAKEMRARDRVYFRLNKWTATEEKIAALCSRCSRDDGARIHAAVEFIARKRLWEPIDTPNDLEAPGGERDGDSAFVLARLQVELWRGVAAQSRWATRVVPRWLPRHVAVVQYVALPDRIEGFLLWRGGSRRLLLPSTSRAELFELVQSTSDRLQNYPWGPGHAPAELAGRLGVPAIGAALPAEVRRLVVSGDGIIANIPFGALPFGEAPLCARFVVTRVPRWQWVLRDAATQRRFASALGVALERSASAPEEPPLTGVVRELDGLMHVTRLPSPRLVAAAARREHVLAALPSHEVIHVACHGRFVPERPWESGVLLDDDWLTIDELRTLDLRRLRLAIIAACRGAEGRSLPGAESVSLPMTLMLRGAASVVTPLWEVGVAATGEFMAQLYQAIAEVGPAEALTRTQRAWYEARRRTRDWAGYCMIEAGLVPRRPPRWWLALVMRGRAAWRALGPAQVAS